jgi:hypothetical protein
MRIDNRVVTNFWLIAILSVAITVSGCSKYPKVTSHDSLDFIKQVYTASNTKNVVRLAACKERLAVLESEGKISDEEFESFKQVLEFASNGDWERAQSMALQFAQDQVR